LRPILNIDFQKDENIYRLGPESRMKSQFDPRDAPQTHENTGLPKTRDAQKYSVDYLACADIWMSWPNANYRRPTINLFRVLWGGLGWSGLVSVCFRVVWGCLGWSGVVRLGSSLGSFQFVWGWSWLVFWAGLGWSGTSLASACFGWSRMSGVVWCGKGWSGLVSACFGMVRWVWGGKRKVNEPGK